MNLVLVLQELKEVLSVHTYKYNIICSYKLWM